MSDDEVEFEPRAVIVVASPREGYEVVLYDMIETGVRISRHRCPYEANRCCTLLAIASELQSIPRAVCS